MISQDLSVITAMCSSHGPASAHLHMSRHIIHPFIKVPVMMPLRNNFVQSIL